MSSYIPTFKDYTFSGVISGGFPAQNDVIHFMAPTLDITGALLASGTDYSTGIIQRNPFGSNIGDYVVHWDPAQSVYNLLSVQCAGTPAAPIDTSMAQITTSSTNASGGQIGTRVYVGWVNTCCEITPSTVGGYTFNNLVVRKWELDTFQSALVNHRETRGNEVLPLWAVRAYAGNFTSNASVADKNLFNMVVVGSGNISAGYQSPFWGDVDFYVKAPRNLNVPAYIGRVGFLGFDGQQLYGHSNIPKSASTYGSKLEQHYLKVYPRPADVKYTASTNTCEWNQASINGISRVEFGSQFRMNMGYSLVHWIASTAYENASCSIVLANNWFADKHYQAQITAIFTPMGNSYVVLLNISTVSHEATTSGAVYMSTSTPLTVFPDLTGMSPTKTQSMSLHTLTPGNNSVSTTIFGGKAVALLTFNTDAAGVISVCNIVITPDAALTIVSSGAGYQQSSSRNTI